MAYSALRFSPDGSHIYYSHTLLASGQASQEYDLYRIPVLGGTPQLLVKDIDTNPSFSHDGQHFVFLRANDPDPGKYHLIIANADGSDEKSIFSGPMANIMTDAAWSPDGKTVAAAIVDQTGNSMSAIIRSIRRPASRGPSPSLRSLLSRTWPGCPMGVRWP